MKKVISFLLMILTCFSLGTVTSFADYFYGAYYKMGPHYDENGRYKNGPFYEVRECNKNDMVADFVMKFENRPDAEHLEKCQKSINHRLKRFKRFTKDNRWGFIFFGSYRNLPTVPGYERHHIISKSALKETGADILYVPAISLRKDVHRKTSSYGSSQEAKDYRAQEQVWVQNEGMREATKRGLNDVDSISDIDLNETSAMHISRYSCLNQNGNSTVEKEGESSSRHPQDDENSHVLDGLLLKK